MLVSAGVWLIATVVCPSPRAEPAPSTLESTWGGSVKIDLLYTTTGYGSAELYLFDYALVPAAIPLSPQVPSDNLTISARETRLWHKGALTTPHGAVGSHLEIDFFGFDSGLGSERTTNSTSPRLRHAYVTHGGLLVGQTWSTWMDLPAFYEAQGEGAAAGALVARQAMVRYSRKFPGPGAEAQIALENPETTLTDPSGARITPSDDLAPDAVVKVSLQRCWGHVALAGMGRLLRADRVLVSDPGASDADLGLGIRLSGSVKVGARSNLKYDVTYGRGIGRYISFNSFNDGELGDDGRIDPIEIVAGVASAQIWLTESARVAAIGSAAQALGGSLPGSNKRTLTAQANVMWNPIAPLRLGIEYIVGRRTLERGDSGDMHRVHSSLRYSF